MTQDPRSTFKLLVEGIGFRCETLIVVALEAGQSDGDVDELRRCVQTLRESLDGGETLPAISAASERVFERVAPFLASTNDEVVLHAHRLLVAARALRRSADAKRASVQPLAAAG